MCTGALGSGAGTERRDAGGRDPAGIPWSYGAVSPHPPNMWGRQWLADACPVHQAEEADLYAAPQ
jgi:hypothetical protein